MSAAERRRSRNHHYQQQHEEDQYIGKHGSGSHSLSGNSGSRRQHAPSTAICPSSPKMDDGGGLYYDHDFATTDNATGATGKVHRPRPRRHSPPIVSISASRAESVVSGYSAATSGGGGGSVVNASSNAGSGSIISSSSIVASRYLAAILPTAAAAAAATTGTASGLKSKIKQEENNNNINQYNSKSKSSSMDNNDDDNESNNEEEDDDYSDYMKQQHDMINVLSNNTNKNSNSNEPFWYKKDKRSDINDSTWLSFPTISATPPTISSTTNNTKINEEPPKNLLQLAAIHQISNIPLPKKRTTTKNNFTSKMKSTTNTSGVGGVIGSSFSSIGSHSYNSFLNNGQDEQQQQHEGKRSLPKTKIRNSNNNINGKNKIIKNNGEMIIISNDEFLSAQRPQENNGCAIETMVLTTSFNDIINNINATNVATTTANAKISLKSQQQQQQQQKDHNVVKSNGNPTINTSNNSNNNHNNSNINEAAFLSPMFENGLHPPPWTHNNDDLIAMRNNEFTVLPPPDVGLSYDAEDGYRHALHQRHRNFDNYGGGEEEEGPMFEELPPPPRLTTATNMTNNKSNGIINPRLPFHNDNNNPHHEQNRQQLLKNASNNNSSNTSVKDKVKMFNYHPYQNEDWQYHQRLHNQYYHNHEITTALEHARTNYNDDDGEKEQQHPPTSYPQLSEQPPSPAAIMAADTALEFYYNGGSSSYLAENFDEKGDGVGNNGDTIITTKHFRNMISKKMQLPRLANINDHNNETFGGHDETDIEEPPPQDMNEFLASHSFHYKNKLQGSGGGTPTTTNKLQQRPPLTKKSRSRSGIFDSNEARDEVVRTENQYSNSGGGSKNTSRALESDTIVESTVATTPPWDVSKLRKVRLPNTNHGIEQENYVHDPNDNCNQRHATVVTPPPPSNKNSTPPTTTSPITNSSESLYRQIRQDVLLQVESAMTEMEKEIHEQINNRFQLLECRISEEIQNLREMILQYHSIDKQEC